MPYVKPHKNKVGMTRIKSVCKNFESFTKNKFGKVEMSHAVKIMIERSSNKHYKQIEI